jgi:isoamylase
MCAGDEYGHTRNGNNNWYGHDNEMTHFAWDVSQKQQEFYDFYKSLIHFRKGCPLLGRDEFLQPDEITWHEDNWANTDSKFLAFTLHGKCVAPDPSWVA